MTALVESLRSGVLRTFLENLYAFLKHLYATNTGTDENELV